MKFAWVASEPPPCDSETRFQGESNMTIKRTLAAGALAVMLSAGSASAGVSFNTFKHAPAKVFPHWTSGNWTAAGQIIGGTFAAWTVFRFFQNCGPFHCNERG